MSNRCPYNLEILLDYRENRLSTTQHTALQQHLEAGCLYCAENWSWITRSLPALTVILQGPEPQVSAPRMAQMRQLFRDRQAEKPRPNLPRLLARLVSGGYPASAMAGARGAEGGAFQQIYATDTHYIDLWAEREYDGFWYLIGLILPKAGGDPIPWTAVHLMMGEQVAQVAQPEQEEFHLSAIESGLYRLELQLADSLIDVPDIRIGI